MILKHNKATEQHPAPGSDLLTVGEAADLLRLKVSTIRAWVLQRRIPFVKLGGKRVFLRRQDIQALVTASLVPAKTKRAAQLLNN
jgi:excisionase family DNA binding protein